MISSDVITMRESHAHVPKYIDHVFGLREISPSGLEI